MNYQLIYDNIIQKAKYENRKKLSKIDTNYVYYENHHIFPKCLGGNDNEENLVLLSAKEHFMCHKLLLRIFKGNRSLVCAFHFMTHSKTLGYIVTSRDYEYAILLHKTIPLSKETKDKISMGLKLLSKEINMTKGRKGKDNKWFGKHHTIETIKKLQNIDHSGKKNSMFGKTHSNETKQLIKLKRLEYNKINLTREQILEIKSLHKIISNIEISKKFKLSYNTVRNIHRGRYDWL